jgi:hypothetical protein
MKKSILLIIFFAILGFKSVIQAENIYSDTIWIKLENKVLLRLVGNDFDHKFPEKMDLTVTLSKFLFSWQEMEIKELSPTKKIEIWYEPKNTSNQLRIIEDYPYKKAYIFASEDSFKFSVPYSNILDFNLHKIQIRFYFSELNQLKEAEKIITDQLFKLLKKNVESFKSIYPINRWYVFSPKDELYLVHTERSNSNQNDLILIGLGTDIQLLKSIWTPGFSGSISLVSCRKLLQRNKYSIYYNGIFDFSNDGVSSKNRINHFIGIGYSYNFAGTPGYKSWYGINVSYLVKNEGTIFEDNTYSIALTKNVSNYLDLQPIIYFSGLFKNIFPSIKMSVHF